MSTAVNLVKDYFVSRNGLAFAGTHLLVDVWGASHLADLDYIAATLREVTVACGATLIKIDLHQFKPTDGVSGVAILAESHVSIHTWPEKGFAALDVFMCGAAKPHNAIAVLARRFESRSVQVTEQKRGMMMDKTFETTEAHR